MLGTQFGDDGVQLRWLAPTDQFIELGVEVGRGRSFPGSDTSRNGAGMPALDRAHTGGDIGDSHSWRAGLSLLQRQGQRPGADAARRQRLCRRQPVQRPHAASGSLDAVWKWAPDGNATRTNFKLQGEYLRSTRSGSLVYDTAGANLRRRLRAASSRAGTCRAIYQFMPRWRVGLRTEQLDAGTADYGANADAVRRQRLPAAQEHADGRLQRQRVLARAPAAARATRRAMGFTDNQLFAAIPDEPGRARRAQLLNVSGAHFDDIRMITHCSRPCWSRRSACSPLPAHAALRVLGLRARVGRAGAGARRPAGRRVGGHHRAAGPAPDPGQAEPDRPRAQRRPGGVHRRRARDRLAAGAAAAIGQRQGAARAAGQLRGRRLRAQARSARRSSTARRATCTPPATRTSRPTRATSRWWPRRWRRACSSSMPATPAHYAERAARLPAALAAGDGALDRAGRAAEGHAAWCRSTRPSSTCTTGSA